MIQLDSAIALNQLFLYHIVIDNVSIKGTVTLML